MIEKAIYDYLRQQNQTKLLPKAVLFDMDGVLFDSMKYHARAWQETSENHHLISTPEDFYLFEGRTGESTVNELYLRTFNREATEEEKQTMYKEKAALFNKYNDGQVIAGAFDVVHEAIRNGLQCLVVTGSGQHSLFDKLNEAYPNCFNRDLMVTAYDVKIGKPHPEPYLMGLAKAGVAANEAIVVENAPMGVESAVAAGIFTIAVNTGPLPDQVLLDTGAHLLYPDMEHLASDFNFLIETIKKANP
ncbi:HAD-IA family hydrolase [Massilibacteroides sp.]|uniref:HAD family hydrolase n=1 Tax=Massilibacteroides sp. TaxID=2034766 RepID=UPI002616B5E0|nr:HAD-IA family hydrolase [Massilibacteroides sp.]MDD4514574.1 HAD-IA family hydrolase [Massilibacteroides sp.]